MDEDHVPIEELEFAEPTIYLPQPQGHRRGSLRFINGMQVNVTASPEELADLVDHFVEDPTEPHRLELRDAEYNEPYYLLREVVEHGHLMAVAVAWVPNPAPETGRRGGVMVAREMPGPINGGRPRRR